MERSLPEVARFLKEHKKCNEIKGIVGITSLTRRSDKLGFETRKISNGIYRKLKWLLQLPILYLSSSDPSIKAFLKQQPHYLCLKICCLKNTVSKKRNICPYPLRFLYLYLGMGEDRNGVFYFSFVC